MDPGPHRSSARALPPLSVLALSFTKSHLGHHTVSGLIVRPFAQSEEKTSTRASKTKSGTISKELAVWATFPTPVGSEDKSLLLIELRKCRATFLPCCGEDPITTIQTLLTAYKKKVTHAKYKSTWLQHGYVSLGGKQTESDTLANKFSSFHSLKTCNSYCLTYFHLPEIRSIT